MLGKLELHRMYIPSGLIDLFYMWRNKQARRNSVFRRGNTKVITKTWTAKCCILFNHTILFNLQITSSFISLIAAGWGIAARVGEKNNTIWCTWYDMALYYAESLNCHMYMYNICMTFLSLTYDITEWYVHSKTRSSPCANALTNV